MMLKKRSTDKISKEVQLKNLFLGRVVEGLFLYNSGQKREC